jgi:hypothetical protein
MAFRHHNPVYAYIAGFLGLMAAVNAQAAPQALALLETDTATPLVCADGICKAEFTTYCLQKERPLPGAGTAYEVVEGGALGLLLTAADGSVRRVKAAPHIRIRTSRAGHSAVVIEMPADILSQFAARQAALKVGDRVTLAPVAVAGDNQPLTEEERRIAAGPLRTLGAKVVDRDGGSVGTVRVLNRLVNAMPNAIDIAPGARKRLWHRALASGFHTAPAGVRATAEREYAACWNDRVVELGGISVRECLGQRHDRLMWDQGERYWNAVGAGS